MAIYRSYNHNSVELGTFATAKEANKDARDYRCATGNASFVEKITDAKEIEAFSRVCAAPAYANAMKCA